MSEHKTEVYGGFSWLGLLGIIFVLCKIFEYGPIALWSWWLVLLPFYVGLAIIFGILAAGLGVAGLLYGFVAVAEAWERRKNANARQKWTKKC